MVRFGGRGGQEIHENRDALTKMFDLLAIHDALTVGKTEVNNKQITPL